MKLETRTWVGDKELLPDENGKITLPKELQIQMLNFFLKTSIPRKKLQEQERLGKRNYSEIK